MAMCTSSDKFGRLGFIDKRVSGSFVWVYATLAMWCKRRRCCRVWSLLFCLSVMILTAPLWLVIKVPHGYLEWRTPWTGGDTVTLGTYRHTSWRFCRQSFFLNVLWSNWHQLVVRIIKDGQTSLMHPDRDLISLILSPPFKKRPL